MENAPKTEIGPKKSCSAREKSAKKSMFGPISEDGATGRGDVPSPGRSLFGNRAEHREFLLDLVVYGCALMNKNERGSKMSKGPK